MANIFVIGDIILDINLFSTVTRMAPEKETLPIHDVNNKTYILGGAANVANNIHKLTQQTTLVGVIGSDYNGNTISCELMNCNMPFKLFKDSNRRTTTKTRIYSTTGELQVRYDMEDRVDIDDDIENKIFDYLLKENNKTKIDAIVLSDYDKGTLTATLCQTIIQWAKEQNILTFVDPKLKNYEKYIGCFLFKPNQLESEQLAGNKSLPRIMEKIKSMIQCDHILLTRGKEGMILDELSNRIEHDEIINVVDVTGAGDIVMAVLVYCYIQHKDLMLSAKIANYIAGKSVRVIGNYATSLEDISEYFRLSVNPSILLQTSAVNDKIIHGENTSRLLEFSSLKQKVVFTNGCFDILHSAHIKLLQYAKKYGDVLIVGINSDESICRIKGPTRPINNINERVDILSCFDFIDYIVIFNEDTPYEILKHIQPDTIIKGGDYEVANIVGNEFAEETILFNYIPGKSSTNVINKIKKI